MDMTPEEYQAYLRRGSGGIEKKMGNRQKVVDGVRYQSTAEYNYKGILDMKVLAGVITGYDFQVPIPLLAGDGVLVGYYRLDFKVYYPDESEQWQDVKAKGQETELFRWKAKHVKAQYGVDIILIDSKTFQPIKK